MKNFKIKLCKFYTIFYYTPTKWQGCSPFGSSPPLLAKESYKVVLNDGTVCSGIAIKGVFGLLVSITQFSVSITHNSKMVGPMTKRFLANDNSVFIT